MINASVDQEASCPFEDSTTCASIYNIRIDTGLINSNTDLGINAPRHSSVNYRKVTTCAVVAQTNWASDWVKSSYFGLPGDESVYYYFGERTYQDSSQNTPYTYTISNYSRYGPSAAYDI